MFAKNGSSCRGILLRRAANKSFQRLLGECSSEREDGGTTDRDGKTERPHRLKRRFVPVQSSIADLEKNVGYSAKGNNHFAPEDGESQTVK